MVTQNATNNYATADFIVDAIAGKGNYTTITLALAAASSGDTIFIKPGTYTENLTHKAGVNLTTFGGEGDTPNVTIVGKNTFTTAGTITISNIRLKTNSDFFLAVTGTAASIVCLQDCFLDIDDNDGISMTTTSADALIQISTCKGDIANVGHKIFASTSAGTIRFQWCDFLNSGSSITPSTISAGRVAFSWCNIDAQITTSGTGDLGAKHSRWATGNNTALIIGGNPADLFFCRLNTGNAVCITVTSVIILENVILETTNGNLVDGAGEVIYNNASPNGNTGILNATTVTPRNTFIGQQGTWTPDLQFGGAKVGITYGAQVGTFMRLGNVCWVHADIQLSNKGSSNGNATVEAFPFTSAQVASMMMVRNDFIALAAAGNQLFVQLIPGTSGLLREQSNSGAVATLTDADFANNSIITFQGFFFI